MTSSYPTHNKATIQQLVMQSNQHKITLRLSERKLLLAIVDLLVLNMGVLVLATQSLSRFELAWVQLWDRIYWFVIVSILWFGIGSLLGIYDLARAASPLRSAWTAGGTALIVTIIYLFIPFLSPSLPNRRIIIYLFPILVSSGIVIWRLIYATIFSQPTFHQRTLIIGAGRSGRLLTEAIASRHDKPGNPYEGTGYEVIGFIDDRESLQGATVLDIPVLGTSEHLVELVKAVKPYEVVVAITHRNQIKSKLFQAILDCRELGVPITTMADMYELVTGRIPVEHAGRNLEVVLPIRRPASFRVYLAIRRLVDLLTALVGCLFLALTIPFVWLVNRFTDPGDLFYRQERVGLGGQSFNVIKFRSMIMNAEKVTGAVWAGENDPRITPMGRILRKTRLDEVPQFWNVLKGEMSMIGPRPERPYFVEQLAEDIPYYRVRHAIKPGITGWAQVKYRYGASKTDSQIKLEYDLYYIKNQSAFLDLQILIKTIQVTLGFKGR